jgi:predicted  nucleic acid-binding Zn-ribbon protein
MFVFHKGEAIEKYEAEISRLNTENEFIMTRYVELEKLTEQSNDRVIVLDDKLSVINSQLTTVNKEIKKFNKDGKKDKEDFVSNLHNDSISVEFTNYLQRRSRR